ncbi:AAA family ATPase [Mesorhizobium huakuii]|nr:AAA family ATPase [Mesorhizobium huakuii]
MIIAKGAVQPDQEVKGAAMELLRQLMSNKLDGGQKQQAAPPEPPKALDIEVWSAAGIDATKIPPREFLLGNVFARTFVSSLFADGATGKTTLRIAQALALASGRRLTEERVHKRCNVLLMCFEDDADELKRRVAAARMHHKITDEEIGDRLHLATPGLSAGKLMVIDPGTRQPALSNLAPTVEQLVTKYRIDLVILDPLKKIHGVEENSNDHMDAVVQTLTDMASRLNIAIDLPHHMAKGTPDPGNANRGRGASALKDAIRLGYTMTHMSAEEAKAFHIPEDDRKQYVRVDPAKVNIARQGRSAQWFKLISQNIGNGTHEYPNGDDVQAIVPWTPPDLMAGMDGVTCHRILMEIRDGLENGERYTDASRATDRCVSVAFGMHVQNKSASDARQIVGKWIKDGVVRVEDYKSPVTRKTLKGLFVSRVLAEPENA